MSRGSAPTRIITTTTSTTTESITSRCGMAEGQGARLQDPDAIYRASFARIRREAPIDRLPVDFQAMALRLIHSCGMPDILDELVWTADAIAAGRTALAAGAPILVDATMVAAGIQRQRLPTANPTVCSLHDERTAARAAALGTTRSAAAVELWRERLAGSVVAIGNAPTALFRLLELLAEGAPPPALVLGFPVGFVGAAEAKDALIAHRPVVPHVTLRGRRGGSGLAAAAVNALVAGTP
jgi:precorrin-8X/cobalt-precorrin-8 methylmutase